MDNMDMPAAEDRHDASRRALLRDALARERPADVVARLRDRVNRDARTGTPRDDRVRYDHVNLCDSIASMASAET